WPASLKHSCCHFKSKTGWMTIFTTQSQRIVAVQFHSSAYFLQTICLIRCVQWIASIDCSGSVQISSQLIFIEVKIHCAVAQHDHMTMTARNVTSGSTVRFLFEC